MVKVSGYAVTRLKSRRHRETSGDWYLERILKITEFNGGVAFPGGRVLGSVLGLFQMPPCRQASRNSRLSPYIRSYTL